MTSAAIVNGLIFTTAGYSFTLIWGRTRIHVFDPHGRDIEGSFIPNGTSVLLEFKSLKKRTEYSQQISNFETTQYALQYIKYTN